MRFETDRLLLRPPRADDVDVWMPFFTSARGAFVGGGEGTSEGRAWRAFASICGHRTLRGYGPFVLENRDSGAALGSVGPWYPGDWPEPELGWTLWHAEHEGHGYVMEALAPIVPWLRDTLRWSTAVSYIDPANERSLSVARRLGAFEDPHAPKPEGDLVVFRHSLDASR